MVALRKTRACSALVAVIAVALLTPLAARASTLPQNASASAALKAQMESRPDPVDRARAFPRYGEALIKEARTAANAAEYEKAEKILTEYRDVVKQLHENLRARVPNPEKKPSGFKQLQIHVRKTLRDLDDVVASVPANLQPPFDFLRKEIDRLDRALIDDLFPRKPNSRDQKGKS